MTVYVMQAKENYDPANVTLINANTPHADCYADQQDTGAGFDFGRRKLIYAVAIADADTTTNSTGHTLWDGLTAVANGAAIDTTQDWNMWIGEKDIDTDAVQFYQLYNVANTVPTGIGSNAAGNIEVDTNPTNGLNIILNGVTWTFVTGAPSTNQTQIQGSLSATMRQLAWDLNRSANAGINVAFYDSSSYPVTGQAAVNVTYLTPGTGGDSYTLAVGTAGASVSGATLTGGTNAHSDGTWRRRTHDGSIFGNNVPVLIDPRNNNVWLHLESCELYRLAFSESFQQTISPLRPVYAVTGPVYPVGVTTQWVYAFEGVKTAPDYSSPYHMYLIPNALNSNETALDKLLIYADYEFPTNSGVSHSNIVTSNFRWCMDHSGNVYFLSGQNTGGKNYKLWEFSPPSIDGGGKPTGGGGFTDVTPWSSSTGPNTNNAAYTNSEGNGFFSFDSLMFLPATSDFVALSSNTPVQKGDFADTYADYFIDCTYINVSGAPSFDYHSAIVTGYMTAAWAPTNLAGAYYAISPTNVALPFREFNLYLGASDYLYPAVDYTKRWFMFNVYPVAGGVVRPNGEPVHAVFVQYQFVSGSPPVVLQVIDGLNWDAAYPAYADTVFPQTVIAASMIDANAGGLGNTDYYISDNGVYDATGNAFWWSGASEWMYNLDAAFTPREAMFNVQDSGPTPPFLKLSFSITPPAASITPGYYIERMDNRIWNTIESSWCLDAALAYPMPTPAATVTASGISGSITVIANSGVFTSSNVGSIIRMGGGIGTVTVVSSTTSLTAFMTTPITATYPNDPNDTPVPAVSGSWTLTVPTAVVSGLDHLEGMAVAALVDGIPLSNLTVSAGSVTLPNAASQILVGLPFTTQLQTLYIEAQGAATLQSRRKNLVKASLRVQSSLPPQIGTNQPDAAAQQNQAEIVWGASPYASLSQIANVTSSTLQPLYSGDFQITDIFDNWGTNGQIAVQQTKPVPLTVLSLVPWLDPGDSE